MKKFLCIVAFISAFLMLATACGKQEEKRELATTAVTAVEQQDALLYQNWQEEESNIVVPIGPEEDKKWVEENISCYLSTYNVDIMIRYVESFRKDDALPYKCRGMYDLASFEAEKRIFYVFAEPNNFYEVMVYEDWPGFAFVIHNTGERGVSAISVSHDSGTFYGLTPNCILFKEDDDNITAVHYRIRNNVIGEKEYKESSYDELLQYEKENAVYPIGYYKGDDKIVHSLP